ncbi:MAG: nucleotidyltransferase domain-containing protein, partial [Proteobacteria bacterium]|nr:nucleotidyltransferase domain-containing protein [Pseudomonadota bacterium]
MSDTPDMEVARRFLIDNHPPGQVLLCAITGSHHYGFSSPDSDLDIKGIHQSPTEQFLGLSRPVDAYDRLDFLQGVECDLTTNEVGRSVSLLLKGNGNMLERIFSPYRVYDTHLDVFRHLARGAASQASFNHYHGYFGGMKREHLRDGQAKSMLYTYRVALTGIHFLNTKEVVAHLPTLAGEYGFAEVMELVEMKATTAERLPLSLEESERWRNNWPKLEEMLGAARDESPLPLGPANGDECQDWLIELRR